MIHRRFSKPEGKHGSGVKWLIGGVVGLIENVVIIFITILLVWAFQSRNMPALKPWHTTPLTAEFTAADATPQSTLKDYLAAENCHGCRNEQCKLFKNCGVRPYHQNKEVDFCYQCDEFPCDRTNFDESLYKGWVAINEIIRKKGIETYCEKAKMRPRYG